MNPATAQSSSAPAASGAAESAKKRSGTSATDALTENGPERPNALAEAQREASQRSQLAQTASESAPAAKATPAPSLSARPMVQPVPPGPPQMHLTGEEFGLIGVGSTAKDVLDALGPPSSRVVVPDDDGHLRESLQYWAKGIAIGIVRLDNGRVVQIETSRK
jgi:hypothetical protein